MEERKGFLGGIGGFLNSDMILWFVIVFLFLFWSCGGFGNVRKEDEGC